MSVLLLGFFTFVLILVSAFLLLIILMQKASSNAGMGATLGGGAAESALGGGAGNVLTKGTIWGVVLFFVVAFGLYLGHMRASDLALERGASGPSLRGIEVEETPVSSSLTDLQMEMERATIPAAPDADTAVDTAATSAEAESEGAADAE